MPLGPLVDPLEVIGTIPIGRDQSPRRRGRESQKVRSGEREDKSLGETTLEPGRRTDGAQGESQGQSKAQSRCGEAASGSRRSCPQAWARGSPKEIGHEEASCSGPSRGDGLEVGRGGPPSKRQPTPTGAGARTEDGGHEGELLW